jgi:hypothetical protein
VGIARTADGGGYWLLGADGGVFSFGDATFYGYLPGVLGHAAPNPMTSIVATPDGGGYWIVGTDGGVFTFGDAGFYGSLPGIKRHPHRSARCGFGGLPCLRGLQRSLLGAHP